MLDARSPPYCDYHDNARHPDDDDNTSHPFFRGVSLSVKIILSGARPVRKDSCYERLIGARPVRKDRTSGARPVRKDSCYERLIALYFVRAFVRVNSFPRDQTDHLIRKIFGGQIVLRTHQDSQNKSERINEKEEIQSTG